MRNDEIQDALRTAAAAQRDGRRSDAARLYGKILQRAGEHPVALNGSGMLALAGGDFAAAAAFFGRAIAVDPESVDLRMNLATAHRRQGNDAAERLALDGALALDQRHFMALVRLAELFERTGDVRRASDRWSGVLAMAPLIDQRTPALEAMFEHARTFVSSQQADFARSIDSDLAGVRAERSPAERRRFDACIDHLVGRRQIFPNVCAGLHFPFLPADEFFPREYFPWLARLEAQTGIIRQECVELMHEPDATFTPYVMMAPGTPANKWSPLDQQPDWGAFHLWKNGVRNEAACARCPATTALLEALPLAHIPGRAPTIFFSLLRPGARLPPHTGVTNTRTIVHLPLVVPEDCGFRVGGETRTWRAGEAWAFDDTIEHEAWNNSAEVRVILIFDVWNPHLSPVERDLLRAFYPVADAHGYDRRERDEEPRR